MNPAVVLGLIKLATKFVKKRQNGNVATGVGAIATAVIAIAGQFGYTVSPELAAAIVTIFMAIVAAGKGDDAK